MCDQNTKTLKKNSVHRLSSHFIKSMYGVNILFCWFTSCSIEFCSIFSLFSVHFTLWTWLIFHSSYLNVQVSVYITHTLTHTSFILKLRYQTSFDSPLILIVVESLYNTTSEFQHQVIWSNFESTFFHLQCAFIKKIHCHFYWKSK